MLSSNKAMVRGVERNRRNRLEDTASVCACLLRGSFRDHRERERSTDTLVSSIVLVERCLGGSHTLGNVE